MAHLSVSLSTKLHCYSSNQPFPTTITTNSEFIQRRERKLTDLSTMAASAKTYLARRGSNYRFLAGDPIQNSRYSSELELDESDVWGGSNRSDSPDSRHPPPGSRHMRRASVTSTAARGLRGGEAASLPVNIPDWSKILRSEYKDKWSRGSIGDLDGGDDDGEYAGDDDRMPPHEYLARTRMASFSVHEGIGRTLKGRDLSMVRNAIWEKTGFQD